MLTENQKKEILDFVDNQEIDLDELESFRYYANSPEPYNWDEEEEYNAKCEQAVRYIQLDGLDGYFDWDKSLQDEVIEYIIKQEII